jgi:hypothetical protein
LWRQGAPEGFETAIIEPTSPRGYGAGTLIMGVVAPVIMAVLAVPVWIMFFNV